MIGYLVGPGGFPQSGQQRGEKKFDKGRGVAGLVAGGEDLVAGGLLIADDRFDGEVGGERRAVVQAILGALALRDF